MVIVMKDDREAVLPEVHCKLFRKEDTLLSLARSIPGVRSQDTAGYVETY